MLFQLLLHLLCPIGDIGDAFIVDTVLLLLNFKPSVHLLFQGSVQLIFTLVVGVLLCPEVVVCLSGCHHALGESLVLEFESVLSLAELRNVEEGIDKVFNLLDRHHPRLEKFLWECLTIPNCRMLEPLSSSLDPLVLCLVLQNEVG